jgi:hypothetical protein
MAKSRAPKPLKIAVYAIRLNKEAFVDRCMAFRIARLFGQPIEAIFEAGEA